MISAFANTFKIPELRQRILFTLAMVVIVRVGAAIPLPGVNAEVLQGALDAASKRGADDETGMIGSLINVFSGGGLKNCAVFALGIMPYISASIMMQLLTAVVPRLSKLAREDGGRSKINMYTRYATIILCVVQGWMLARSLENPANNIFLADIARYIADTGAELVPGFGFWFVMVTVVVITAGTMLMMWIGEQITERGIGNGISLIIAVNIVSALPGALVQVWQTYISGIGDDGGVTKPIQLVMLVALLIIVIAAVISITQAVRKITIQYAKRVVGRKVYGGQSSHLPLKVNYAGVMPIIFAQAIMLFPAQIINFAFKGHKWAENFANSMTNGWVYFAGSGLLIFFFSYFWVATMFQPQQIADDLKKNGGYVPGVRPGKPTAAFLDFTMSRLTFAGACFLTIVALLPSLIARKMGVSMTVAQFFGGTSLLILVGVLLDIMRQAETHLIQRHYDGFLRKGKIRGRFDRRGGGGGKTASKNTMIWLYTLIAIMVIVGVTYAIAKKAG